jgi:hypothetical protein
MQHMPSSRRLIVMATVLIVLAGVSILILKPWQGNALVAQAQTGSPGSPGSPRSEFAADRGGKEKAIPFDAKRAFGYLEKICEIGPRISGSEGMAKQQELLQKHFEGLGAKVELQRFTARQRSQKPPVAMANLIARWHPERLRRIILCAHYDTRPRADQEPNPRDQDKPFLGANDGGSGPALLMELAHHMKDIPLAVGVDFVLFDGEEYIFDNRPMDQGGDLYFFGSEHFAKEYGRQRSNALRGSSPPRYIKAVLVDMVAGKHAHFYWEQYSAAQAGALCEEVWQIAADQGIISFIPEIKHAVLDDHLALLRAGIPTIDIIDFDYVHWHRLSDAANNCSGETMEQVAKVLVVWMQRAR